MHKRSKSLRATWPFTIAAPAAFVAILLIAALTRPEPWLEFLRGTFWPIVVVLALWVFRPAIHGLIGRVTKLKYKEAELTFVDITTNVSVAKDTGSSLTAEHFALIHSCWRADKLDVKYHPNKVYRFDVVLQATGDVLDRVDRVTYLLPPAWATSPNTTHMRRALFGLKELTWADVLVRANVYVKGQDAPIHLSTFVRLTMEGPHLVPKV